MTGDVIVWKGITRHDMPPDQILDRAKGNLKSVIVMGWDNDGEIYFASSAADGGDAMWLMEWAKKALLEAST